MCIFCNNEIKKEEMEKCYVEQCNNCNGKVVILKNNGKIIASRFPKNDKSRLIFSFSPLFLIGLFLLLILFGRFSINYSAEYILKIILIGIIIFVIFAVYCCIKNILNYRKNGYMYYGINNVITEEGKKSTLLFSKIYNYFLLFFGIQFVIVMSLLIFFNKV
jgi:hypothetical protein